MPALFKNHFNDREIFIFNIMFPHYRGRDESATEGAINYAPTQQVAYGRNLLRPLQQSK